MKKTKTTKKPLQLYRQTIRVLEEQEVRAVAGGVSIGMRCYDPTNAC